MEWREDGIVLGVRRLGETSVIVEVMTRERGRHLGLVRGGRSRRQQPVLQPGNSVAIHWRARLDEHMGSFVIEPVVLRAARLMENGTGLNGVQLLAAHLRLLPERDPHARLYDGLAVILDHLGAPDIAAELVLRFEIALLEELGFGLDLSECAATGRRDDLFYVSPKSGRAVSRDAGAPYRDRLLLLPAFLVDAPGRGRSRREELRQAAPADGGDSFVDRDEAQAGGLKDLIDGFQLTGYFLDRHVFQPRGIAAPVARAGFLSAIEKSFKRTLP